jgi:hypothetical protein
MSGTVLLIGCSALSPRIQRAGWQTVEAEYFWGSETIDPRWVAAIVDFSVGGESGLMVAERLRRKGIIPVILFRPEERDCVLPRFLGVEARRGSAPGQDLETVLRLCAEQRAMGSRAASVDETLAVEDSMIVAIRPNCSRT